MIQTEIPGVAEPKQAVNWLKPPKAKSPAFWISEIRILRQLSSDPDDEIRRISLRKGLNIVWSPPGEVGGEERQRGRGHAAGKTSFCRAIRYLLGERHYGNKFISGKIAESLGLARAYLVAAVWIGDVQWAVARPLYQGGRQFAFTGVSIDEAILAEPSTRLPYEKFTDALGSAVLSHWEIRHFDSKGEQEIKWLHVLQALARDQEAHLSSLHNWRVPLSASESPDMSDSERPFLMRCLMGLADKRENAQLQNRAKQQALQKTEDANVQFYARSFNESLDSLKEALPDLLGGISPTDDLFIEHVKKVATAQSLEKAKKVRDKITKLGLPALRKQREDCVTGIARIKGRIEEDVETLEALQTKLKAYQAKDNPTPKDAEELRQSLLQKLRRGHHCGVPVETALDECPVYWRLNITKDLLPNPVEDRSAGLVIQFQAEIEKLQNALQPYRADTRKLEKEQLRLEALIQSAEQVENELNEELSDILGEPSLKVRLAHNIVEALQKKDSSAVAIQTAVASIDKSDKLLEEIRRDSVQTQERLSSIFNAIVENIAGRHMRGELRFTKIETNAALFREGEVVSEAFNAIKALAYDFTALTAWLNGIGHHPGFLLHDSPRESDMEPSLYQPYFHFIAKLAEASEASFQYIVTTTEPPPAALQGEPPVCLRLDGSKEDGSLYREVL